MVPMTKLRRLLCGFGDHPGGGGDPGTGKKVREFELLNNESLPQGSPCGRFFLWIKITRKSVKMELPGVCCYFGFNKLLPPAVLADLFPLVAAIYDLNKFA
jgi:hypothetical protein